MLALSEFDLGWFVGMVEGEGCFYVNNNYKGLKTYRYPKFEIASTDEDVIDTIVRITGMGKKNGPYQAKQKNTKPHWKWQIRDKASVVELAEAVLPHMHARRSNKIKELLEEFK